VERGASNHTHPLVIPFEHMTTADVTLEDLLGMVARMIAREPHVRCREGSGSLAPLAVALNRLSSVLSSASSKVEDIFGAQALIAQSPNPMFSCDIHGTVQYVNFVVPPLSPADFVGTNFFSWNTPETVESARSAVQKVLATGEPSVYEAQGLGITSPSWFSGRVGPIKVNERIVGFTVIITDITESKKTQQLLEQSNRELESFAYVASHDLQEPLRKIQTIGERLRARASTLDSESLGYVERMQQTASRMRRLIDDLLAFSQVSSKIRPFTPVELGVVAREVLDDLETAIEGAGAHVSLGELPILEADPSQMRQLLQNLMGNALKFRRIDVPLEISVRGTVDLHARCCELVVEDNGIGFEEKYADRIFEAFQRLHSHERYEGTGLGLAICRKIAERHGGSIRVRSTPGSGSAFRVTLPLKQTPST
jgi:PAS domain S-box-containing protein